MAYSDEKDLFPFIGRDADTDIILFFTDGKGEPKKLNVRRAIEGDTNFTGNALGYSGPDLEDFISACPKAPSRAIRFSWNKNLDFEGNFKRTDGIQYAYQNVYVDGFVTAISPLSEVAFPPSIQTLGSSSISSVTVESECILQVPQQGSEISRIKILFREGNDGSFKLIEEVSNTSDLGAELFDYVGDGATLGYYTFRNDSVYPIVPSSQTSKNFDNLPRRAKAQSVSGNRLMYGNYLEGFDPVSVVSSGEVLFQGVDQSEALSSSGTSITAINVFANKERDGGTKGESIGFSIDYGSENIAPGVYTLSIDMTPERNFHIFDAKAYHPSKNITFNGASDFEFDGITLADNDAGGPFPINNPANTDFQIESADGVKMLHGYDPDRNGLFPASWQDSNGAEVVTASIGSTAANPLIIPGNRIKIEISFEVVSADPITSDVLASAIEGIISTGDSGTQYVQVLSYSGQDLSGFNFEPASLNTYSGVATVVESSLPLSSKQTFSAKSAAADCISWVPNPDTGAPAGFFIIKDANLLVDVVPVNTSSNSSTSSLFGSGENPQTSTVKHYVFRPRVLSSVSVLTCIPEPVNGIGSGDASTGETFSEFIFSSVSQMPFRIWGSGGDPDSNQFGNSGYATYGGLAAFQQVLPGDYSLHWQWPCVERKESGSPGSGNFVENPNFPKLSASFDRDGNELAFKVLSQSAAFGIKSTPIAIDKWHVFEYEDIFGGESWKNNFSYELNLVVVDTIVQNHTPISTASWIPGISTRWAGYISGIEGQDTVFSEGDQAVGNSFYASMIDGAAGVGSKIDVSGYSSVADNEVFFPYAIGDQFTTPANFQQYSGAPRPVSNRRGSVWNTTLIGIHENFKFIQSDANNGDTGAYITPSSPTDQEIFAAPLQDLGSYLDIGVEGSSISSFKTRDYHDFGVVYFDKRGRAGSVNPLPSVYVPGYSNSERGIDEKGAVVVQYKLVHLPPDWAEHYKIVYAGAANTERFIQYSAGGAYVDRSSTVSVPDKIYVSLNYLQSNKASYARSYGAVDQDTGESTLYRFTPGDKLRVISYYTDNSTIEYAPKSYEFDVVGVEEVSIEQENPFLDLEAGQDGNLSELLPATGSFVVLRDNRDATGFSAADVDLEQSKWGDRCIFEIVTPKKSRGDEQKVFYETPFGGGIIIQNGRRVHQYGTINIDQGDVFFRKVPVNLRGYDDDSESFTDIISASESNETSVSRFRPYFLESSSVSDIYRSNSKSFGRPHFVIDRYSERINDTSIIYSDATNQESFNVFYTSFNPLSKNYFDLPAKYGDIDYIADAGDQIYVAQNSKIGKIQVNKSLTSTASGSDTLNLSREVLNSPRFFLEDVGTGGHPESVTWDDSTMYFVDQGRGVVVSAGETGMKFLSSAGMEKFFKKLLAKYKTNSRITTGVNPFTDELVVSVMSNDSKNNLSPTALTTLLSDDVNTISYDLATGSWITSYTFYSSEYANVGDRMISFKNRVKGGVPNIAWKHDNGDKNSFYGVSYPSFFTSVLVDNANLTKDFKSISIDGSKPWDLRLSTSKEFSRLYDFKDYEGTFYTEISRSENDSSKNNIKGVGKISSISQVSNSQYDLKFERDISEYHITLTGMTLNKASEVLFYNPAIPAISAYQFASTNGAVISIHPIEIVDKYTLRVQFSQTPDATNQNVFLTDYVNKGVLVKSDSKIFGDSLRDKFITITASSFPTGSTDKTELYSINVDYIESNLNSSR